MSVESGSPAPFDDTLAKRGMIVPDIVEHLLGYENAEELADHPDYVEVTAFGREPRYIPCVRHPRVEARPLTESRVVWRWA